MGRLFFRGQVLQLGRAFDIEGLPSVDYERGDGDSGRVVDGLVPRNDASPEGVFSPRLTKFPDELIGRTMLTGLPAKLADWSFLLGIYLYAL